MDDVPLAERGAQVHAQLLDRVLLGLLGRGGVLGLLGGRGLVGVGRLVGVVGVGRLVGLGVVDRRLGTLVVGRRVVVGELRVELGVLGRGLLGGDVLARGLAGRGRGGEGEGVVDVVEGLVGGRGRLAHRREPAFLAAVDWSVTGLCEVRIRRPLTRRGP